MTKPENTTPESENSNHTYVTHHIPWYVHLIWVGYWVLCLSYILYYQFPIITKELLSPP